MMSHVRVLVVVLLFITGCKKDEKVADKGSAAPSSATGSGPGAGSAVAKADESKPDEADLKYAKPMLTDDIMKRYIKSLSEGKSPFAIIGAVMGSDSSLEKADAMMKEQEVFAKKYGFSGQDEYLEITGRIMLGQAVISTGAMTGSVRESMVKGIADIEKQLADPSTSAETKAELAESLKDQKQSLADMEKDKNGGLNDEDLAMVKKYNTELEAAFKANEAMQKKK